MPLPFISVVVPLYNKAQSFPLTAGSVMAQTYENFEVVVIDDGSTDESLAVASALGDARFRIIHQTNGGVSVARNRGVSEAKSDYIAFLDADDLWDPAHLATLAGLIERFPEAVMWGSGYRPERDGATRAVKLHPAIANGGLIDNYFQAATYGEQPFYSSSVCVRKDTLQRIGGFRPGLAHAEDLEVWARIALRGPVAFSPASTVTYCLDTENRAMDRWPALTLWPFDASAASGTAFSQTDLAEHAARVNLYTVESNLTNPDGRSVRAFLAKIETQSFGKKRRILSVMFQLPVRLRLWLLDLKNGRSAKLHAE